MNTKCKSTKNCQNLENGCKNRVAVISAKNHKRQRRKHQSVTAKREKSETPKTLTAILTLPNPVSYTHLTLPTNREV